MKRNPNLGKLKKVTHVLAEIHASSTTINSNALAMSVGGVANSSSLFTTGTLLYANSISNSDIVKCNNKYWALQSKSMASRVWEAMKILGVEGTLSDECYVGMIS